MSRQEWVHWSRCRDVFPAEADNLIAMPSERYIPPTDEELARMVAAEKAAKRFEQQRTELLLRAALR